MHFAIANKVRTTGQLIAEPDNQEQRDTDIGRRDAAPVDGIGEERFVVLAQRDNQAQHEGEDRPQREEPGAVRQVVNIVTLHNVTAAEAIMANRNPQPGDKAGHPGGVQQPQVHGLVAKHRRQEAQTRNHGGRIQRVTRHAATGELREDARRFAVTGQGIQHTGRGVHPGVPRRQYRRQDNRVHNCCRREQTRMLEHQSERADGDIFHVISQQAWVGVRNDQADDQNREHIEQQNTPEHLTHRARNILLRIFRFARRNTDKFGPLEGETDDHRHADHRRQATGKRRVAGCPVAPADRLCPLEDAEDHHNANDDEDNHGRHFDQREPVFRFAEALNRDVVQQENDAQEQRAPDPARCIREPPAHHQLRGHQVNGDGHRPVVPVVPAQREAEALFHIVLTVGGERTGYRHISRQFAQAGHQEVNHQANQNIGKQRAARARLRNGCAGRNKQPRTDRTANGDHRQVTRLEFAT